MSFSALLNYVFQAMKVDFTCFGITLNLWGVCVWTMVMSVIIWFINQIRRM